MLLPALLLSASLSPLPQDPAVTSRDVSARSTSQDSIDAGLRAFKKRRFAAAEVEFRRAMEADPSSAAPVFYLAYTYYKMAEPKRPFHPDKQKSKDMFAKAYEMDPLFRPVWGPRPAAPTK